MKKTLSIILCLVMVLSLTAVSISAAPKADEVGKVAAGYTPEGTGIESLDQITDPAGKYYLTKDITVSSTYTTEFTGTFDGNGKKITTSVALFEKVKDATIQNFSVEGTIALTEPGVLANAERTEDFYAAVAIVADGKSTFKNILSDVDMSTTSANTRIAAIAASSNAGYDLVIDTCVNKGDISVVKYAAGVYGWTAQDGKGVVKNCANYGKITSTGGYIAGVVNRLCGELKTLTLADVSLEVTDCANYGEVTSTGGNASGILAYHNKANLTVTNCVNEGKIDASSGGAAAGISASPSAGDAGAVLVFKNCTNKAPVSSKTQMGGIVAYANVTKATITIENCVNEATITGMTNAAYGAGIIGRAGGDNAAKEPGCVLTIKNCTNKGDVIGGKDQCGGMIGYDCMMFSTYTGCKNYGKVTYNSSLADVKRTAGAGILGSHKQAVGGKVVVNNCVNYGEIAALDHHAGGIVATCNVNVEITNCVNYADVSSKFLTTTGVNSAGIAANIGNPGGAAVNVVTNCANFGDISSNQRASGIVGYAYGAGGDNPIHIEVTNCLNAGVATSEASVAAQLVAYTNNEATVIKNNLAIGSAVASGETAVTVFVAGSTAQLASYDASGNYYAEGSTPKYYTWTATEDNAANVVEYANAKAGAILVATKAQLASGEVAYNLNAAIGKEVFKQNLGSAAVPTFSGKSVLKNVDGTYSNPASAPTGDISAVIFVVAVLTLGSAVVIGKKVSAR